MYGGWMNNGAMLYKGVQDYTGGPNSPYKYKLDAADTEYYIVAGYRAYSYMESECSAVYQRAAPARII
jgi:hypothetical protein